MFKSGRHFLQIPGPSNVPDRVLRAIDRPTMDHRGPEFGVLGRSVLAGCQAVFGAETVIIFPSSGTGAWEAAFVNTLSPGDRVLSFEIGEFARLWAEVAARLGLDVQVVDTDWTAGVDPAAVEQALAADPELMAAHNNLALTFIAAGNPAAARNAFLATGDPAGAAYNRGIIHMARREYTPAATAFEEAIAARPGFTAAKAQAHDALMRAIAAAHD